MPWNWAKTCFWSTVKMDSQPTRVSEKPDYTTKSTPRTSAERVSLKWWSERLDKFTRSGGTNSLQIGAHPRLAILYLLSSILHFHDLLAVPAHPASAKLARQQIRVSGAVAAQPGDFDRGQFESRQGVQFRLHLLPGRSPQRGRDEVRRDRPVAGRNRSHALTGHQWRLVRGPSISNCTG